MTRVAVVFSHVVTRFGFVVLVALAAWTVLDMKVMDRLRSDPYRRDRAAAIEEATTRARNALNLGDHEAALTACRQVLQHAPDHVGCTEVRVGRRKDQLAG